LPALARRHRVIAPDSAGFGCTERREGTHDDMDRWVNDLVGLLGALALAMAVRHAAHAQARADGRPIDMLTTGIPRADTDSTVRDPALKTIGQSSG
jgi:pimeloyl-ACP methyl ester carboxylesterase